MVDLCRRDSQSSAKRRLSASSDLSSPSRAPTLWEASAASRAAVSDASNFSTTPAAAAADAAATLAVTRALASWAVSATTCGSRSVSELRGGRRRRRGGGRVRRRLQSGGRRWKHPQGCRILPARPAALVGPRGGSGVGGGTHLWGPLEAGRQHRLRVNFVHPTDVFHRRLAPLLHLNKMHKIKYTKRTIR